MVKNPNNDESLDAEIERLVDTRGYSYDEARRQLGVVVVNIDASISNDGPIHGPLSSNGQTLNDLLHSGFDRDKRKFSREVSKANMAGKITNNEREILYSRKET